jgi:hypothetical protein
MTTTYHKKSVYQCQSFLYAAFAQALLDLGRDVDEFPAPRDVEPQFLSVALHTNRILLVRNTLSYVRAVCIAARGTGADQFHDLVAVHARHGKTHIAVLPIPADCLQFRHRSHVRRAL